MIRALILRSDVRLLTLTGPPGVGKTRLALEVVWKLADWYEYGPIFVDLTSISDPAMAAQPIARALGLREGSNRPLDEQLAEYLGDKELLLVLDNFEHVAAAGVRVADLLAACRGLKVLATSRVPLHLTWEHERSVPPLPVPPLTGSCTPAAVLEYPAAVLFNMRAQAVQPDFMLTGDNARAVAEICARLDGLPLAIELAAASTRTLTPHAILERLRRRLSLLSVPARDLPARHRTLRGAIGWSYALLPPAEQTLFRRVAVFAGGCAAEAASAVAGDVQADLLEDLAGLVDKSLLQRQVRPDGTVRFRMLETVREFGLEQLAASGEIEDASTRHGLFFLELAEQAEAVFKNSGELVSWLVRLDEEHGNLRAALEWALGRPQDQTAIRLAGALWPYWSCRGAYLEGRGWLERALAQDAGFLGAPRLKALMGLGTLAFGHDDYAAAERFLAEALTLARRQRDTASGASVLTALGHVAWHQGHRRRAHELCREGLARARASRERWALVFALVDAAAVAWHEEDWEQTEALCQEVLVLSGGGFAPIASPSPSPLTMLGSAAQHRNDLARAEMMFDESLALGRRLGDRLVMASTLVRLGDVARLGGRAGRAWARYAEALRMLDEIGERWFRVLCLEGMAATALDWKVPQVTARLLGAAQVLRKAIGAEEARSTAVLRAAVRKTLTGDAFQTLWAEGRAMSPHEAVAYALSVDVRGAAMPPRRPAARHTDTLTRRELEVAALLGRGLSNREIASALFIAETTAAHHVEHILEKLQFRSRAQVAAWAVQHNRLPPTEIR